MDSAVRRTCYSCREPELSSCMPPVVAGIWHPLLASIKTACTRYTLAGNANIHKNEYMYFKRQIILLGMVVHNFNLSTMKGGRQFSTLWTLRGKCTTLSITCCLCIFLLWVWILCNGRKTVAQCWPHNSPILILPTPLSNTHWGGGELYLKGVYSTEKALFQINKPVNIQT